MAYLYLLVHGHIPSSGRRGPEASPRHGQPMGGIQGEELDPCTPHGRLPPPASPTELLSRHTGGSEKPRLSFGGLMSSHCVKRGLYSLAGTFDRDLARWQNKPQARLELEKTLPYMVVPWPPGFKGDTDYLKYLPRHSLPNFATWQNTRTISALILMFLKPFP